MEKQTIIWEAHEYDHRHKTPDWYWALGIVVIAGAVGTFLFGNFLLSVLIVLGGFMLAIYAAKAPDIVRYELSSRGIRINDRLYPYASLDSFWVTDEENPKLLLKSEKTFMPLIVVPLGELDHDFVIEFLLNFIEEEEQYEPITHKVMEYLGF